MSIEILPFDGALTSAAALCRIAAACELGECQPAETLERLGAPTTRVWVAQEAGQIIGFVATFETQPACGRRLEVDLLGVAPAAQGRGAATALIRQAVADWAGPARALIRVGNSASERAFARNGFAPASDALELLVRAGRQPAAMPPGLEFRTHARDPWGAVGQILGPAGVRLGACELLPITTMTDRGVWVESITAPGGTAQVWRALAEAAAAWTLERRLEQVGALLPAGETTGKSAFEAAGYRAGGQYRFFQRAGWHI